MSDGQSIDGDRIAIGSEKDAGGTGVTLDRENFLSLVGIPNSDRAVHAAAGEALAVAAECHAGDSALVPLEDV